MCYTVTTAPLGIARLVILAMTSCFDDANEEANVHVNDYDATRHVDVRTSTMMHHTHDDANDDKADKSDICDIAG